MIYAYHFEENLRRKKTPSLSYEERGFHGLEEPRFSAYTVFPRYITIDAPWLCAKLS